MLLAPGHIYPLSQDNPLTHALSSDSWSLVLTQLAGIDIHNISENRRAAKVVTLRWSSMMAFIMATVVIYVTTVVI